ncbi:MAG: DinB family protein [Chitinophagaceae bacterium]
MERNKIDFLQSEYSTLLQKLDEHTKPLFGKMNVLQMIEHMSDAFRQASGLIPQEALHNEAITQKMYQFMMSDKPFKDNTPNPNLPEEPLAVKSASKEEAIHTLQKDIQFFINTFKEDKDKRILNPFFGNLNQEEWIHLLHKHAWHHLRQFNINP